MALPLRRIFTSLGLVVGVCLTIIGTMMESKLPKIMFGAVVAVVTAAAQPAYSQAIEVLGEFRDWAAYRLVENGNDT